MAKRRQSTLEILQKTAPAPQSSKTRSNSTPAQADANVSSVTLEGYQTLQQKVAEQAGVITDLRHEITSLTHIITDLRQEIASLKNQFDRQDIDRSAQAAATAHAEEQTRVIAELRQQISLLQTQQTQAQPQPDATLQQEIARQAERITQLQGQIAQQNSFAAIGEAQANRWRSRVFAG
ncbi:MAG: hypothetical protein MUF49_09425 [Oculatellaceae cyanobacterium Prado106]|jgi:SMC interacting uncharacterized protein involved in chromosome segregation|nr:hypothetical protein [Oculatellaceae cyanobacterium Prado106]